MPTTNVLKVLYVEDNPDDCALLDAYLSETPNHGLEIVVCETISAALAHCATDQPDAALLDLNLPDSTGLESFFLLSNTFPDLPIIVFTVLDLEDLALDAVRAGAQDYLVKGELSGALIVRAVRYAVERKEVSQELEHHKTRLESLVRERTAELIQANEHLTHEIHQRQQVQDDLTQSRHILRTVADNIPAFLAFVGQDLRYKFVNKQYELAFGIPVSEIVGMTVMELNGQETFETQMKPHVNAALSGSCVEFEISTVDPLTQEERWVQINYQPFKGDEGTMDGYFVLGRDITDNKRNESRLREQRQLLQDILDGMQAAVVFVDIETFTIVRLNKIAEELIGMSKDELLGSKCYKHMCMHGNKRPENGCPASGERTLHNEFLLTRPDGRIVPVTKTVLPVMVDERMQNVAIMFDISERKSMERQLAYAQKLESIGQLAAGIAHEINTPIQYVGSNLHFLRSAFDSMLPSLMAHEDLPAGPAEKGEAGASEMTTQDIDLQLLAEEVPKALEDSLEGVDRVATIVQAMKTFSHPDMEERKLIDINAAIENTVTIARNEWKYVAKVKLNLAENIPPVYATPGDVNQALLNILVNAAHAISEKYGDNAKKGTIFIQSVYKNNVVHVSITDDGCGIPESISTRIFDPFFTTKEVGKGTGQGLAITLSMLNKQGGAIDFISEEGQGTTFFMTLPTETNA